MDFDLLENLGKIAGLAGIAFGAFFLIFRGVIQKNIFPKLDRQQSYKIINTMILMASVLTVLGLGSWFFLEMKKTDSDRTGSLATRYLIGTVVDEQNSPVASATVEVSQFPNIREYSDSDGRFVITLNGKGTKYVDLLLNHKDYQTSRKKVKVDYDSGPGEITLNAIAIREKATPPVNIAVENESPGVVAGTPASGSGENVSYPPESTLDKTSITLVYAGDPYGCVLDLVINVAGQGIKPTSNSVLLNDIPLGRQPYSVNGNIYCPGIGNCNASGSDRINVEENGVYNLLWSNDDFSYCSISLVSQSSLY